MEKELNIYGYHFVYCEEALDYSSSQPMSITEGEELMHKVKFLFSQQKLDFYLGYGTLLGAVRNHGIIPGDEDLDVIVKDERKLLSILPFLKENGLLLIRACKGNVYSFRLGQNSYIDVYIIREIPWYSVWSWYCYSISNKEYCPKKIWKEIQTIEFLGETHLCPKNPENILTLWYGADWMTPKSGHKFYYEVKSHFFYKELKKRIKAVISYDRLKAKFVKR